MTALMHAVIGTSRVENTIAFWGGPGRKRGTSLCVVLGWLEAPVEWKNLRDQWTLHSPREERKMDSVTGLGREKSAAE